jgi:hypothetical protein
MTELIAVHTEPDAAARRCAFLRSWLAGLALIVIPGLVHASASTT